MDKGWIKTGVLAVVVYVGVFLFNKFFLSNLPDNFVYRIVNAPVYFLLQLFGVVSTGIFFWLGVLAYFILGVIIYFIAKGIDLLTHKTKILEEKEGEVITKENIKLVEKTEKPAEIPGITKK